MQNDEDGAGAYCDQSIVQSIERRSMLRFSPSNLSSAESISSSLSAIGEQFDALHRNYWSERQHKADDETLSALVAQLDALVDLAIKLTATSQHELLIKARMAKWMSPAHDLVKSTLNADYPDRIVWSLARDLLMGQVAAPCQYAASTSAILSRKDEKPHSIRAI
jgi:hypothetical protein